jgi:hypothetical protein
MTREELLKCMPISFPKCDPPVDNSTQTNKHKLQQLPVLNPSPAVYAAAHGLLMKPKLVGVWLEAN